ATSPLAPNQLELSLRVASIEGSGSRTDSFTDGVRQQTNTWHLSAEITALPTLSNPTQQGDLLIYAIPSVHVHLVFQGVARQAGNPSLDIPAIELNYNRTRDIQTDLAGMFLHYSISKSKVVFVVIPIPDGAPADQPNISSIQYRDVDTHPFPNVFITVA